MRARLEQLRERFYLFVGPLAILLAVGIGNHSAALAWVSGVLLALLALNWLAGRLRL
ncbi:hypothetical protein P6144_08200 [Sphingomonas sp. HITSZ_GF]|uniref:hypothetical protein n=1 Tax=Sphingomonas sp. HITSZ_GF TaxID=3037247 RepID=UPI00240D521B|nr:hypothetical protein [Sphingomonas sp. HITSZ_GF]MDG2533623.1 hypothetical protein [Sphingomonas sp. HITSZ_GF]